MNTKRIRIAAVIAAVLAALSLASAQMGGFLYRGPLGRLITPNGDGRNDFAIFCFDNPSDSGVEAKVFSLSGALVSAMSERRPLSAPPSGAGPVACPAGVFAGSAQFVYWDGKSNGAAVSSGVYLYQIRAEGQAFTGTLVVVR